MFVPTNLNGPISIPLQWKGELEEILQLAQDDTDQRVAMVGNILKTYPTSGALNTDVDDHHNFFHQVQSDLKKLGKFFCMLCELGCKLEWGVGELDMHILYSSYVYGANQIFNELKPMSYMNLCGS